MRKRAGSTPKNSPKPKKSPSQRNSGNLVPLPKKFPYYSPHLAREGDYAYVRIDVVGTLKRHPEGKQLLSAMKKGSYTPAQRSKWCKILLTEIHRLIKSWYPHQDAKVHLAMDIIRYFPKLASTVGKPWGGYFNGKVGHLVCALNSLRISNNVKMRKINRPDPEDVERVFGKEPAVTSSVTVALPQDSDNESNPDDPAAIKLAENILSCDEKVKLKRLAMLPDTPENRAEIFETMKEFHAVQRNILKQGVSTKDFLDWFPKLLSYSGDIINEEFKLMGLNSDFSGAFPVLYEKKILTFVKAFKAKVDEALVNIGNETVRAFAALVCVSPVGNRRAAPRKPGEKGKKAQQMSQIPSEIMQHIPHPALIQIVPGNTNVETHQTAVERKSKLCAPYLLWVSDDMRDGTFFIKAEHFTVDVGHNALYAMDMLLKFHYVFDLEYDKELVHFWDLIEHIAGMRPNLQKTQDEFFLLLRNQDNEANV